MLNQISIAEAAERLPDARRIMIVGISGGGKSTLARRIDSRFQLDYQSLDRDVFWLPGWQLRDDATQREMVRELVARERWVMDGTNTSTFDLRVPRADLVIWVRIPRIFALIGVYRRVARSYGKVRPDMADGCPERLPDRDFLSYISTFEQRVSPKIIAGIERYGQATPVVILSSRAQFEALFDP